ncbi:MAG TPA: hypothetical protein EYQ02_12745, partial [Microbacterium sp.]|nr:hypothetical protein [Microbacterium sp.]
MLHLSGPEQRPDPGNRLCRHLRLGHEWRAVLVVRAAILVGVLRGQHNDDIWDLRFAGVFGVFGHADAAALTALGLHALQH